MIWTTVAELGLGRWQVKMCNSSNWRQARTVMSGMARVCADISLVIYVYEVGSLVA